MSEARKSAADPLIGQVLDGRYAIEAQLGEGGLGVVYRATQTRLGRLVAVKVLAEHARSASLRARFEREARSLATLVHPNIVQIIDFGIADDAPFLVMELLEGRPLNEAIRAGIELERAFEIGRTIVGAVAYAHARRIVHRDLKPANVFLQRGPDGDEIPRVLDFGLAKFLDQEGDAAMLTNAGAILGTPSYMSPEQASGTPSDTRSDVYSLGIVLYELLAGVRPFRGAPEDLLRMHLFTETPTLESARPGIPYGMELDAILRRATAKAARDRYADAGELLAALDALPPLGRMPSRSNAGKAPARAPDFSLEATVAAAPSTKAKANATENPKPAEPRRIGLLLLVAGVLAIAVVGGAIAAFAGDDDEPGEAGEPAARVEATAPEVATVSTERGPSGAHAAAAAARAQAAAAAPPPAVVELAPGASPPLPPELDAIARSVPPGGRMSFGDRRILNQWSRAHPNDPRAWLLMAHADFLNGARTDALTWYENAAYASPAAANDPVLRRDLVIMAGHRRVGSRAQAMVLELFRADAADEIDAALAEVRLDPEEQQRLAAFRASLR